MPCLSEVRSRTFVASRQRLQRVTLSNTIHLLLLVAMLSPLAAPAAVTNYIWTGAANPGTGNARWNRAANWTNNIVPAIGTGGLTNTDITLAGSLKLTPVLENNYFIRSLIFDPTAGAFTLGAQTGSEMLAVGAGGIVNQSTNTQTILTSLSLSNSQTWDAQAGDLNISSTLNLGANIITVVGANDVTLAGLIQGSGQIVMQGTGELILGGTTANTYSGGTMLNNGALTLTKANALGSGPLTITSGTLSLGSFNQTVGLFSMSGGTVNGSGNLTASGYQVQGGTINAQIAGSGSLVKSGAGTTTLTAANTYSGGTIINDGTLAVNNLTGSGTGPGFVLINPGGMLIGRGNVLGVVTNGPGGTISAGADIGQLNTGPQFWMGGSTFRWEIEDASSTAGVGWDLLNVSGALNVVGTAGNKITFDVASFTLGGSAGDAANFDPYQNYLWKMVQTSGGIIFQPGENETTVFDLMTGGFANALEGGTFSFSIGNGGQDLYLVYTAVPEPDVISLIGLAACAYIYGRRFKRNWGGQS
ncbi:MAG TPA: autotransporter-associated beta strand repeat-containing protein [Verrucomicrobiae bacterium]|nr:autotransporter-associated beta strand repeat-containing protein [Verrucomicrobiae bacterium]